MEEQNAPARPDDRDRSNEPPKLREEDRRSDGTKGNLDLDKDAAAKKQRHEKDDASNDGSGTGIPGFGV